MLGRGGFGLARARFAPVLWSILNAFVETVSHILDRELVVQNLILAKVFVFTYPTSAC
jgi:hypothetical protein